VKARETLRGLEREVDWEITDHLMRSRDIKDDADQRFLFQMKYGGLKSPANLFDQSLNLSKKREKTFEDTRIELTIPSPDCAECDEVADTLHILVGCKMGQDVRNEAEAMIMAIGAEGMGSSELREELLEWRDEDEERKREKAERDQEAEETPEEGPHPTKRRRLKEREDPMEALMPREPEQGRGMKRQREDSGEEERGRKKERQLTLNRYLGIEDDIEQRVGAERHARMRRMGPEAWFVADKMQILGKRKRAEAEGRRKRRKQRTVGELRGKGYVLIATRAQLNLLYNPAYPQAEKKERADAALKRMQRAQIHFWARIYRSYWQKYYDKLKAEGLDLKKLKSHARRRWGHVT